MDDLISRKALMDAINRDPRGQAIDAMRSGKVLQALTIVLEHIQTAPTIEAEPVRHGRWVQCFEDWRQQIDGDKCSVCGFEHYGTSIKNYNYCPNCGAKMDKED